MQKELPFTRYLTIRTICEKGRITYDPAGHRIRPSLEEMLEDEKPWHCFWEGTATINFATIIECNEWFKQRYKTCLKDPVNGVVINES